MVSWFVIALGLWFFVSCCGLGLVWGWFWVSGGWVVSFHLVWFLVVLGSGLGFLFWGFVVWVWVVWGGFGVWVVTSGGFVVWVCFSFWWVVFYFGDLSL